MVEPGKHTRPRGAIKARKDTTIATIILYKRSNVKYKTEVKNFLDPTKALEDIAGPTSKNLGPQAQEIIVGGSNQYGNPDVKLLDNVNAYSMVFNNFVLQSVSESDSTINKVHMNFSDSWNVFFFNENPTMLQFTGGFIDTEEFPYYQEFMTAYKSHLSGSKVTGQGMSMLISYDGKVVDGYITSISTNTSSESEGWKPFQITVLAKSVDWVRYNKAMNPDGTYGSKPILNHLSNQDRLVLDYGENTPERVS